ncbi:MAG: hypothetical protein RLZZ234_777 [Candidatus Parcubacteria bacterium]|jgi:hypothetical protein
MHTQKGFVALITVLILSAVLMVGVVSLAQVGITSRYSLLDLENKTKSESLAHACVAVARIAVVNDPLFSVPNGGKRVVVGNALCFIETTNSSPSGPPALYSNTNRVKVTASSTNATTNYQVDIHATDGAITRFVELAN